MRFSFPIKAALMCVIITFGCTHDPIEQEPPMTGPDIPPAPGMGANCNPDTVYFVNDILPLLNSSCGISGCHDEASARDGVVLTDYQSVIETADVRPLNAEESELYEVLVDTDIDDRMPPEPRSALSDNQIQLIRTWINQGASNNSCTMGTCDLQDVTYSMDILPIIDSACKGCHSGSSPSGNVSLDSYENIKLHADDGRLYGSVAHLDGFSPMPQNQEKLDQCLIDKIKSWIDDGAKNN